MSIVKNGVKCRENAEIALTKRLFSGTIITDLGSFTVRYTRFTQQNEPMSDPVGSAAVNGLGFPFRVCNFPRHT
jgi:hypothetical protein